MHTLGKHSLEILTKAIQISHDFAAAFRPLDGQQYKNAENNIEYSESVLLIQV